MKKLIPYILMVLLLLLSGCTQVVTVPISIAGSVVSATIDVAGSTVHALTPDSEED